MGRDSAEDHDRWAVDRSVGLDTDLDRGQAKVFQLEPRAESPLIDPGGPRNRDTTMAAVAPRVAASTDSAFPRGT